MDADRDRAGSSTSGDASHAHGAATGDDVRAARQGDGPSATTVTTPTPSTEISTLTSEQGTYRFDPVVATVDQSQPSPQVPSSNIVPNAVVLVVDTLVDENDGDHSAGDLSLSEAIALAADGARITFDAALAGATITLGSQIVFGKDLTIDGDISGDGAADITLGGGDTTRIFRIDSGEATLRALHLTGGYSGLGTYARGGAVEIGASATVVLINSTISDSRAYSSAIGVGAYGGAILNFGTLTAVSSTFTGNSAAAVTSGYLGSGGDPTNTFDGGDPMLGALSDNGGPVMSRAPLAGSPLHGGVAFAILPPDTFDLDGDGITSGEALPLDANRNVRQFDTTDIGAVETVRDLLFGIENLIGSGFDDVLLGDAAANSIEGGAGSDVLSGEAGSDVLYGGAGFDALSGVDGGAGVADTLFGGADLDIAYYFNAGTSQVVDLSDRTDLSKSSGEHTLDTWDSIEGVYGANAHSNTLTGDGGDNLFLGGSQADMLYGADGSDVLTARGGDDLIYGGAGNDFISGDAGDDEVFGGSGNDVFYVFKTSGIDRIRDYSETGDGVLFNQTGATQWSDLTLATVGNDVHITLGGAAFEVIVEGATLTDLDNNTGNFAFL